jgi:hypothetical protein
MSIVLLTVVGPAGPIDLAVPADQPLSSLLDPLSRALGHATQDPRARSVAQGPWVPSREWLLAPMGGDPLPLDQSLTDCGVADGAVLVLLDGVRPVDPRPQPHLQPPRPPRPCAVVGVLSASSGMGRTAVAVVLSRALAAGNGGPTVAVDAHPGAGSLSERVDPGPNVTAGDLLAVIDHPALSREELLACLAWSSPRLALLAARPGSGRGPPLTQRDWRRLVRGLARHGLTVVMDCGPGLGDPGARAALAEADQVVLVVEQRPSAATRWMAHALANQGLGVAAVSWPAPTGWECRVAETLAADWTALGIVARSARDLDRGQGLAERAGSGSGSEQRAGVVPAAGLAARRVARAAIRLGRPQGWSTSRQGWLGERQMRRPGCP